MTTQIPMLDRPVEAGVLQLRPYQAWSVDELARAKRDGNLWTILCAPTGSGKTECAIHLIDRARKREPWNLVALCQACHLSIQSRVDWEQGWMLDLPEWMRWRGELFAKGSTA